MDNGKISVRYARALFQLAQEQGSEAAVYDGLTRFAHNYLLAISQFNEVLADPIVAKEEKVKLVEMAVGEPMHDCLKQFIAFVVDQKREDKMFFIAMKPINYGKAIRRPLIKTECLRIDFLHNAENQTLRIPSPADP